MTSNGNAALPSLPRLPRSNGRARGSTSSTPPVTPISAARSSGSCRWLTVWCFAGGRRRRPDAANQICHLKGAGAWPAPDCGAEQSRQAGCGTRPRPGRMSSTCSPLWTPTKTSLISHICTPRVALVGRMPRLGRAAQRPCRAVRSGRSITCRVHARSNVRRRRTSACWPRHLALTHICRSPFDGSGRNREA